MQLGAESIGMFRSGSCVPVVGVASTWMCVVGDVATESTRVVDDGKRRMCGRSWRRRYLFGDALACGMHFSAELLGATGAGGVDLPLGPSARLGQPDGGVDAWKRVEGRESELTLWCSGPGAGHELRQPSGAAARIP